MFVWTETRIWPGVCVSRLGLHVAVKVLKSGDGFTQAGQDELALLRCVSHLFFVCLCPPWFAFQFRTEGEIISFFILPSHSFSLSNFLYLSLPHSPLAMYYTLFTKIQNAFPLYFFVLSFLIVCIPPLVPPTFLPPVLSPIRQVVLQAVIPLVKGLFSCWMSLS